MTSDVVSVRPYTPFKDVVDQLVRRDVSGVPVIDEDRRLVDKPKPTWTHDAR